MLHEKAEGKFDLPDYKDPQKHEGSTRAYLTYTNMVDEFVKDEPFSNFVSASRYISQHAHSRTTLAYALVSLF